MKDTLIYFCGSIKGGREYAERYRDIIGMLESYGKVLTEHIGDQEDVSPVDAGQSDKYIHDRDMLWIREAKLLVAEVTVPSLGVGYEIGRAIELGKPVLCLFDSSSGRTLSAMIAGSEGVEMHEYTATEELKEIFDSFISR